MSRILWTTLVVLWISLATLPLSAAPVFRVTYPDTDNSPRATGNGTAVPEESPGITVELLQMVAERLDIELEFKRVPWKRGLYLVEHGLADAIFHASYKPVRAEYGVYPSKGDALDPERALYIGRYSFYINKNSAVEWDGGALQHVDRSIGTQLSFAAATDLRRLGYPVEESHSVQANMDKLQAGRISAYAEIESIADSFLRTHEGSYPEILKLEPPFKEKVYFLMIAKGFYAKHPALSEAIFDAIRDLKGQAAYAQMVDRYR